MSTKSPVASRENLRKWHNRKVNGYKKVFLSADLPHPLDLRARADCPGDLAPADQERGEGAFRNCTYWHDSDASTVLLFCSLCLDKCAYFWLNSSLFRSQSWPSAQCWWRSAAGWRRQSAPCSEQVQAACRWGFSASSDAKYRELLRNNS